MVPPPPAPDALLGKTVDGRWRILRIIGSGLMGVVYMAEREGLGRPVALKLLHEEYSSSDDFVRRFAREARALSRLSHIHCISILDVGMFERRPYIVMELVAGRTLTAELDAPTMTPARAVSLVRQVLIGLSHAHGHGIVHRDLKPDNIMVAEVAGVGDVVKILDFGFAHILDGRHSQSNAQLVPGTPSYMSPEQARGLKVDPRTDLYSTGVILYQLCVGQKPFVADEPLALLELHIRQPPVPPRTAAPGHQISEALEQVILRALEKDRERRFPSAAAFQAALEATPEGRLAPGSSSPSLPAQGRGRLGVIAAAVALVALGAAAALALRPGTAPPPPPAPVAGEAVAPTPAPAAVATPVAAAPAAPDPPAPPPEAPAAPDESEPPAAAPEAPPRPAAAAPVRAPKVAQPCQALEGHSRREAQRELTAKYGRAAADVMKQCILRTRDRKQLYEAVQIIEALAGRSRVDGALVAQRELELAQTCEQRKRAVETLGLLRARQAKRALTVLERERQRGPGAAYACLGQSVREALARIK